MKFKLIIILSLSWYFGFGQVNNYNTITVQDVGMDYTYVRDFGTSLNSAGDFNGDGNEDLVFSARLNSLGSTQFFDGGFWIGLMNGNGQLDGSIYVQKELRKYFDESIPLDNIMVDLLGDLDGNGVNDFILGLPEYEVLEGETGALATIFMEADGSIKDLVLIEQKDLGIGSYKRFGRKLKVVGDINKDGVNDLAVTQRDYGTSDSEKDGAIFICFMTEIGTVLDVKIIENEFVFSTGGYFDFGIGLDGGNDFNGDGNLDIIVGGSHGDPIASFGNEEGTAVIIYLNESAEVLDHFVLSRYNLLSETNFFTGDSHLGESVCSAGDLDGDGIPELIVTVNWSDYGIQHVGNMLVISLNEEGDIKNFAPLFDPLLEDFDLVAHDHIGTFLETLQDYNGDGFPDVVVAVEQSYDGGWGNGEIRLIQSDFSYLLEGDYFTALDNLEEIDIILSPNPSHDFLCIKTPNTIEMDYHVYDVGGNLVDKSTFLSLDENQLDIRAYKSGFYWLRLTTQQGNIWRPFVKVD